MPMNRPIWTDEPWKPLPELTGVVKADVCVVGLGGSGLTAVEEASMLGATVVGVDAGEVGGRAAGANGGFLLGGLADFFHRLVTRIGLSNAATIYRCTLEEIHRLALEFPNQVRTTGSLRIAATPEEVTDCHAHLAALQSAGFDALRYAGAEGEGLYLPMDAVYQPRRCVQEHAAHLTERGIALHEDSPVVSLSPGRVVTRRGEVHCRTIVAAVDGGLEDLFPELRSRVRTARLQMLATAPAREVYFPRPVYYRHGHEYWQQLRSGEIALGGFRDVGGEGEWTNSGEPGGAVQQLLEDFLRTHLRVTAPITHRWAASVAYTADRLPVLEEVRERIIATGAYSGTGNITGRLCGRAAARIACQVRSGWAELLRQARTFPHSPNLN